MSLPDLLVDFVFLNIDSNFLDSLAYPLRSFSLDLQANAVRGNELPNRLNQTVSLVEAEIPDIFPVFNPKG